MVFGGSRSVVGRDLKEDGSFYILYEEEIEG